jgi:hypothetical protein
MARVVSIGVPLLVAVIGAFMGMFLPIAVYEASHSESFELHNVFWESIFGLGFYIAGVFGDCFTTRWIAIVGVLGWPLVAMVIVFFVARSVLNSSRRTRLVWGAAFLLSLVICVGHEAENYLSIHYVPLYWNLYATCY